MVEISSSREDKKYGKSLQYDNTNDDSETQRTYFDQKAHMSLWSHFSDQHFRFQVLTVTASSCHTCMNVCLQLPKYSTLLLIKELIKHIFAMSVQARWIRMGTAYTDDTSEENQIKLIVHRFNFYTHNINIVGRLSHWRGSV